jgi:hypothetical protein
MTCTARRHDTMSAYRQGCRCPDAREAWRLYKKRRTEGRQEPLVVSGLGTARRLQALAALGWPLVDLAVELGCHKSMVGHLQTRRYAKVLKSTADRVDVVFRRLSMKVGPSDKARRRAQRNGWSPPLAWNDDIDNPRARAAGRTVSAASVDEALVVEAIAGRRQERRLNQAEAQAGIRLGIARGLPAAEIARRLGINERTVHRVGHTTTQSFAAAG